MTKFTLKGLILSLLAVLTLSLLLVACGGDAPTATSVKNTPLPATTAPATTGGVPVSPTTAAVGVTPLPTVTGLAQTVAPATTAAPQPTTAPATTVAVTTAVPTTAPATNTDPFVAYIEAGSLNIITASGAGKKTLLQANNQQVVNGRPDWSPDNKNLVVPVQLNKGPNQLFIAEVGGSTRQLIPGQPGGTSDDEPEWSPDGKTIIFTRTLDSNKNGVYENTEPHEIWAVDQDGQNSRKLAAGRQPSWAPDSQRIAFVTNGVVKADMPAPQDNALHLINARGQNEWEPINTAKIPEDLSNLGYPFGPATILLQYPTWLDGGKTIGFTTAGHSGLMITLNSSSGKDLKIWDTQYEGGFGSTDSLGKGTYITYQAFPASGYTTIRLLSITGTPNLEKFSGINIGGPQQKVMALYPALTENSGLTLAYFKISGSEGTGVDLKSLSGSLVVARVNNGAVQEKELLKGNIQGIVWSK
jgi:Tol biopolymer transport system component